MRKTIITIAVLFFLPYSASAFNLITSATSTTAGVPITENVVYSATHDYGFLVSAPLSIGGIKSFGIKLCYSTTAPTGIWDIAIYDQRGGSFTNGILMATSSRNISGLVPSCGSSHVLDTTSEVIFPLSELLTLVKDVNYFVSITPQTYANTVKFGSYFAQGTSYLAKNNLSLYVATTTGNYNPVRTLSSSLGYSTSIDRIGAVSFYNSQTLDEILETYEFTVDSNAFDLQAFSSSTDQILFGTTTMSSFSREAVTAKYHAEVGCGDSGLDISAKIFCALFDWSTILVMPSSELLSDFWYTMTVRSRNAFPFSVFWKVKDTVGGYQQYASTTPVYSDIVPSFLVPDVQTSTTSIAYILENGLGNNRMNEIFLGLIEWNDYFRNNRFWSYNVHMTFRMLIWIMFGVWLIRRSMRGIGFQWDLFNAVDDVYTEDTVHVGRSESGDRVVGRRHKVYRNSSFMT